MRSKFRERLYELRETRPYINDAERRIAPWAACSDFEPDCITTIMVIKLYVLCCGFEDPSREDLEFVKNNWRGGVAQYMEIDPSFFAAKVTEYRKSFFINAC